MSRWVFAICAVVVLVCDAENATAISGRAFSITWQTDMSDCIINTSVIATKPLQPQNEFWDAQEVVCKPMEGLKGTCSDNITLHHCYRNARHPWAGTAPAIQVGQRVLVFLVESPGKKREVIEWINLSRPNREANPLVGHTAYDNRCKVIGDEPSILSAVRERVKTTAKFKDTKRRGVIVMFGPPGDIYVDFVIPADPQYRKRFVDALKSNRAAERCDGVFNLVSYPGVETIRLLRSMQHDPATETITVVERSGSFQPREKKRITYYPVRQAASVALSLLGETVDQPVLEYEEQLPAPFVTGFEDEGHFPYGNWKRLKDIVGRAPIHPFDFLKGRNPVTQSHTWRELDYTFAFQADFDNTRKAVEMELLRKGFKIIEDDPHGYGRKWRSITYKRDDDSVTLYEHMRYVASGPERPCDAAGDDSPGWVSLGVTLYRLGVSQESGSVPHQH